MAKLDKKTLKHAAKIVKRWAKECEQFTKPRYYWDASHHPSRGEMAGRKLMLDALAKEIKGAHKELGGPDE
jgi:hypothetical protein